MNISDLIALGSFLVALLAAVYARWAWREARRANDIAAHAKRMEIYKAFDALRFAMVQKADSISHEDVGRFYFPSRDSEFYFSPDVHDKVRKYFEICFGLAEWNSKKTRRNPTGDELHQLHKGQDRLLSEEAALSKEIDAVLRGELKIARE